MGLHAKGDPRLKIKPSIYCIPINYYHDTVSAKADCLGSTPTVQSREFCDSNTNHVGLKRVNNFSSSAKKKRTPGNTDFGTSLSYIRSNKRPSTPSCITHLVTSLGLQIMPSTETTCERWVG